MTRFRRWPLEARIELLAGAIWIVLGAVTGIAIAAAGGTVYTLSGAAVGPHSPAWLVALNVGLPAVLLALPFLAVGGLAVRLGRSWPVAAFLAAAIFALACLGVAVAAVASELVRGSALPVLLDRAGGSALVFGLCAVIHGLSAAAAARRLGAAGG